MPDIISRIQSDYEQLSRAQKRIADYIIAHPDEACFMPLKQFSKAVDATEVTVVSFTRKIGLNSFLNMKKELQRHIRTCLTPNEKIAAVLKSQGVTIDIGHFIESEKQTMAQTYNPLDGQTTIDAISLLERARRVYVIGFDVAAPVAEFLTMRFRYLGMEVIELSLANYSHMMLEVYHATMEDLFILISFPVHEARIVALSRLLAEKGLSFIAFTNDELAPINQGANAVLICNTDDVVFYNSITAAISLVNLLSTMYAVKHQDILLAARGQVAQMALDMQRLCPADDQVRAPGDEAVRPMNQGS